ncbi:MAG: Hpt domain-containing protein, partial [Myxococcota bacterium]
MDKKDDQFLKELLAIFKVEADEHLREISTGLLELEKLPAGAASPQILETIYRGAHSLKGAARAVDLTSIEQVCQSLENVLSKWKKAEIRLSPDQFDVLYKTLDAIGALLSPDTTGSVDITATRKSLEDLVTGSGDAAGSVLAEKAPVISARPSVNGGAKDAKPPVKPAMEAPVQQPGPAAEPAAAEKVTASDTVRISTAKLDALFVQSEEMLSIKHISAQRVVDHHLVLAGLDDFVKNFGRARGDVGRLVQQAQSGEKRLSGREMERVVEFFEAGQDKLKALESRLSALERLSDEDHRVFGSRVDNLLEDMKKVLLLPFNPLLNSFLRMVRDISRQQGKEVDLQVSGGDVEIDKRILEEIKDPLIHILRNCVDHGIESPAERNRKGKPRLGSIKIAVSYLEGGIVEILVS